MIIDTNNYKNIIFDLGGVILNIDYSLTEKAFSNLGISDFKTLFSQAQQTQLFDNYEKGFISSDDFREEIKKQCINGTSDEDIDFAWNSIVLDLPKERLDFLMSIKKKYRTFLLSNTNEIHMLFIYNYLKETFSISNLNEYFEKVYLSYEVQMRKPDTEIFELVIDQNKLLKEETLFIDDSVQHVESAKLLGIHTLLLDVQKQDILYLFE